MPREQFIAPAGVAAGGPFFLLGFLPLDFPLVASFLVGFLSLASQNGWDLSRCGSLAFSDRFSVGCRLKVVGICHPTTARQIPTISPAPRPRPPIGGPTQIETLVATRDAQLFR